MAQRAAIQPSPLRDDQVAALADLVRGLNLDQLSWASGYLAGLAGAATHAAVPETAAAESVTILFGSQTGNGKDVAGRLREAAAARGLHVSLKSMAEFKPAGLKRESTVLVVVSTHGEGDPPEDAEALHEYLFADRAPRLDDLNYAVLALGDSSYAHFCKTGRDIDMRLAELGARRLVDRVDCDVDYDEVAETWIGALVERVADSQPVPAASPVVRLRPVASTPLHDRRHPFPAEVLVNQRITAAESDWQVHHLELALDGSGLSYRPGDSVAVLADNPPATVQALVEALRLDPAAEVDVGERRIPLGDALGSEFEITGLSRGFVDKYAALSSASGLGELLEPERRVELADWMGSRHIVDVVRQYPARLSAQQFVGTLRKLTPRLYSISSGPAANPNEVHLTVAALRFDAFGTRHDGAASTFLADRVAVGDTVPLYIEPNERFRLPADPDVPVIMIGPGTGVAPFRAFVEERGAVGARGRNWLLFGARTFANDFLYQLEWLRHRRDGLLTRLDVAFSRDQDTKVYVQHRMLEHGRDLYAWLEEGAHVYVCGSAGAMAADVHAALERIVAVHGGRSDDAAAQYLRDLKTAHRYQRDVY